MQAAGGSYLWLQRQVCWSESRESGETGEDVYEIMNRGAAQSTPGAHGLLFLPYLQGERSPHWNPKARGGFVGLQVTHTGGFDTRHARGHQYEFTHDHAIIP
jgi:xylulokinase